MARVEADSSSNKAATLQIMDELFAYFNSEVENLEVMSHHSLLDYSMMLESSNFVSMIKFNGVPILPPLMTPERREEMQMYKRQAVMTETRIKALGRQKLLSRVQNIVDQLEEQKSSTSELTKEEPPGEPLTPPPKSVTVTVPSTPMPREVDATKDVSIKTTPDSGIYSKGPTMSSDTVVDERLDTMAEVTDFSSEEHNDESNQNCSLDDVEGLDEDEAEIEDSSKTPTDEMSSQLSALTVRDKRVEAVITSIKSTSSSTTASSEEMNRTVIAAEDVPQLKIEEKDPESTENLQNVKAKKPRKEIESLPEVHKVEDFHCESQDKATGNVPRTSSPSLTLLNKAAVGFENEFASFISGPFSDDEGASATCDKQGQAGHQEVNQKQIVESDPAVAALQCEGGETLSTPDVSGISFIPEDSPQQQHGQKVHCQNSAPAVPSFKDVNISEVPASRVESAEPCVTSVDLATIHTASTDLAPYMAASLETTNSSVTTMHGVMTPRLETMTSIPETLTSTQGTLPFEVRPGQVVCEKTQIAESRPVVDNATTLPKIDKSNTVANKLDTTISSKGSLIETSGEINSLIVGKREKDNIERASQDQVITKVESDDMENALVPTSLSDVQSKVSQRDTVQVSPETMPASQTSSGNQGNSSRIRRSSYTLDQPSPALLKAQGVTSPREDDSSLEDGKGVCSSTEDLAALKPVQRRLEAEYDDADSSSIDPKATSERESEKAGKQAHLRKYLNNLSQMPGGIMAEGAPLLQNEMPEEPIRAKSAPVPEVDRDALANFNFDSFQGLTQEELVQFQMRQFERLRRHLVEQQKQQLALLLQQQQQEQALLQQELISTEKKFLEKHTAVSEQNSMVSESNYAQHLLSDSDFRRSILGHTDKLEGIFRFTAQDGVLDAELDRPVSAPTPRVSFAVDGETANYNRSPANTSRSSKSSNVSAVIEKAEDHQSVPLTAEHVQLPNHINVFAKSQSLGQFSPRKVTSPHVCSGVAMKKSSFSSPRVQLTKENKEQLPYDLQPKFEKVSAAAKGFLTRRLLRSEKVQALIKTIKDTAQFAIHFQEETPIKQGHYTMQDIHLQERVLAQLTAAMYEIHEIFFDISPKERMKIIEHSRLMEQERFFQPKSKTKTSQKKKVSNATMKALERRKKAQAAERAIFGQERPQTAPPGTSSPKRSRSDLTGPIVRRHHHLMTKALKPIQAQLSPIKPVKDTLNRAVARERPQTAPAKPASQPNTARRSSAGKNAAGPSSNRQKAGTNTGVIKVAKRSVHGGAVFVIKKAPKTTQAKPKSTKTAK